MKKEFEILGESFEIIKSFQETDTFMVHAAKRQGVRTPELHVVTDDITTPALVFYDWNYEMTQLSPETYLLIKDLLEKIREKYLSVGQSRGELNIIDQVHRVLGVDKIVEVIESLEDAIAVK